MSSFDLKRTLSSIVSPIRKDFKAINNGNDLDKVVTDGIKDSLYNAIKIVMHSNVDTPEINDIWEEFERQPYDTNAQIGADEDAFIKKHVTDFIARHYDDCEKLFRA